MSFLASMKTKEHQMTEHIFSERFVRLRDIIGPNGPLPISRAAFYAGIKKGTFPPPTKLSERISVWRISEIETLVINREQGREDND